MQFVKYLIKSKFINTIFLLILLCVVSIAGLLGMTQYKMERLNPLNQDTMIEIERGMSFNRFAYQLSTLGIVNQTLWLKVYGKLNPSFTQIKAGNYLIRNDQRLKDILLMVSQGQEHQFNITFVEGSTLAQWLVQIAKHPNITKTLDYQETNSLYQQVASALNLDTTHPEGLFFPETYAFTHKTKDIDLLKRAYQQMQIHLNNAWQQKQGNLPYADSYEALIMASIIEKESGQHSEHQIIASVFVNRLQKNMRLQTDPTVIYGLADRYKGNITRKHLREKTQYNTYRINGLPPTPIAMPGKSAIVAALQPAQTDYYYFVSDGKGKHIFSTNLKDHNRAVAKYQLGQ
ncbi:endolytic transglycosylase MltG [Thalassotalea hakodatensis]|uniref:endolytic transglycosylase MltG n=1 Tax=Thalassotalea hakodatensis TaxID=3030492 RepID=UPI002573D133|nr:endolytic transglycosylase MltG [Thalassotalea hakodatensis]